MTQSTTPLTHKDLALQNEILRGVVGSTAHGVKVDGQDDRDEMGICVEPPEYVIGLRKFEQWEYRTQPTGVRSGPGDLDLTVYSLHKWMRLAVAGNPSVLALLWLPGALYMKLTPLGDELIALRGNLVSAEAGKRFLGYLVSQRKALCGERSPKVSRPELVAAHGYDTKFAMHALRLGYQGAEYLSHGRLTLPVQEPQLSTLRAVRAGDLALPEVLGLIDEAEGRLRTAIKVCNLEGYRTKIDRFLIDAHQAHWRTAR